jgi:hypothetical protein
MRSYQLAIPLLLGSAILARGQPIVSRHLLGGSGVDTPAAVAIDSQGYVYVAGATTAADFPVANALEPHPPQGALEVSVNGASFVNSGLIASTNIDAQGVTAVAASSDGMLVIASASGGSYRSTDAGVTWKPTADALALAMALAVDPVDSSNAYAILPGGALYLSSNGGVNWRASGTTLPTPANNNGFGLAQLAINPRQPATLYAQYYSNVFRSTDGAQSWQPLSIPVAVSAFAVAPSQPNILYAAAFEVAGVTQLNMTLPKPAVAPFAVYFDYQAYAYVYVGQ